MKRFRVFAAIPALVLVGLTGCVDDGTSVGGTEYPGGLVPEAVIAELDDVLRPLQAGEAAASNLEQAFPSLASYGMVFGTTPPDPTLRSGSEPGEPLALEIPEGLLGTTFTYLRLEDAWRPAESRTDAPSDAVRVIWYELDGTGLIAVPLAEQGYLDLTDESDGVAPDRLGVVAVDNSSGSAVTLFDFEQAYETTTASVSTESWDAAGFYGDGTSEVIFSMMSEEAEDVETGDGTSALEITLEGPGAYYELRSSGTVDGATGETVDELTATARIDRVPTVVTVTFVGAVGSAGVDATGTLTHGGTLVANISSEDGLVRFTDPDGQSYRAGPASVLSLLYRTLLSHGLIVTQVLPFYFR